MTLEDELRAIVRTKLAKGGDVDLNAKLADAGLDSLDLVEIGFDVEDKFRIQLPPLAGQAADVTFMDLYRLVEEKLAVKAEGPMDKPVSESPS
jgi:acyl carrier protein